VDQEDYLLIVWIWKTGQAVQVVQLAVPLQAGAHWMLMLVLA
jgi:hypothetical protein